MMRFSMPTRERVELECRGCGWRLNADIDDRVAIVHPGGAVGALTDLIRQSVSIPPHNAGTDPDPVDLPTFHGAFIGYRAWQIADWQLGSTGIGGTWTPGVNEATCATCLGFSDGGHTAPHPDCECGLYALARFSEGANWWNGDVVTGAVRAWGVPANDHDGSLKPGDVAEAAGVDIRHKEEPAPIGLLVHATGFRARYAQVVLLATSDEYASPKNAAIRALAQEHAADVCKLEHLEDAAKEHGQLVPDDLLAEAGRQHYEQALGYYAQGGPVRPYPVFAVPPTYLPRMSGSAPLPKPPLSRAERDALVAKFQASSSPTLDIEP
jgi:hypothetical protein